MVRLEDEPGHPSGVGGLYTVPLAHGDIGQPAGIVRPTRAVCSIVEGHQRVPVSYDATGTEHVAEVQAKPGWVVIRHLLQAPGNASNQLVVAEVYRLQVGQVAQLLRYLATQPVAVEGQIVEVRQVAEVCRNLLAQLVDAQVQSLQVGQVSQFRRYLPSQLVISEVQSLQVGRVAQFLRYLPGQLVAIEEQPGQVGQVSQLLRYLPA